MAAPSAASRRRKKSNVRLSPTFPSLTTDEADLLLNLQSESRTVRRGQEIITEGRRCTTLFILTEGIAIRYRVLRDGQRQVISLLLPGDLAGLRSCFFESAPFSVKTVTKCIFGLVPFVRVIELFDNRPQLAAKLFCSSLCETVICADHLVAVGRRSAVERVAHFMLELLTRLQVLGLADERSFRLRLTQEIIGDVLGLSKPYVSRVLQELRHNGLVNISGEFVVIENIEELSDLADFKTTYLEPRSITQLLANHADRLTES